MLMIWKRPTSRIIQFSQLLCHTSLMLGILFSAACNTDNHLPAAPISNCDSANMTTDSSGLSKITAIIKTPNGNITFKFYPQKAPNTVTRICDLINQGFYNGLSFHRVIPNFVVQTGDPSATGQGGSGKNLMAEFNDVGHINGTLAMARRENDPNSADSQFYIALARLHHLDGKYTVFGQVIEGLDILPLIRQGDQIISIAISE